MMIVFGGRPGTGKTTVSRALAATLGAVYLRIDSIEQALLRERGGQGAIGPEGYVAAYAIARDNLLLGYSVVADAVNGVALTRDAWTAVAEDAAVEILGILLICSDPLVHRERVESRQADIAGHVLPTWQDVVARDVEAWPLAELSIDTATVSVDRAVALIIEAMHRKSDGFARRVTRATASPSQD